MRRRTMLKGVGGLGLASWSVRSVAADVPTKADLTGDTHRPDPAGARPGDEQRGGGFTSRLVAAQPGPV